MHVGPVARTAPLELRPRLLPVLPRPPRRPAHPRLRRLPGHRQLPPRPTLRPLLTDIPGLGIRRSVGILPRRRSYGAPMGHRHPRRATGSDLVSSRPTHRSHPTRLRVARSIRHHRRWARPPLRSQHMAHRLLRRHTHRLRRQSLPLPAPRAPGFRHLARGIRLCSRSRRHPPGTRHIAHPHSIHLHSPHTPS